MNRKSGGFFGKNAGIRQTIYLYFTVSALATIALIGVSLWGRLSGQFSETLREENQMLMRQVNLSVDGWLRQAMKLSDSLYYGVIKNADVTSEQVNGEMTLLYNNNRDSVANIALFSEDGELLSAVPATRMKDGYDVCAQEWFEGALERTDNLHFTTPHVQHIFDNNDGQYRWVISMSRSVELIHGTSTEQGVLLVDMSYTSLRQLLENIRLVNGGYLYLVGGMGEVIYHPQMQLLGSGFSEFEEEGAEDVSSYRDGSYLESVRGEKRDITVRTVGYTGWRLIGVVPEQGVALNNQKTNLFMVFLVALFLFILILINALISSMITTPIRNLEKSVNAIEEGNLEAEVYVGGSYEIRHLGRSIRNITGQIRKLMSDIVAEHEAKRKSDFAMLQAQINPHFLYNTLDILVWMIENGQKEEAAQVVTALARFFRISLSGGRSII
ncbi:MAG: histidine kinase, partial [Clostridiales bacterium]|nr:histidine kinase [Clostridiales bacterium]